MSSSVPSSSSNKNYDYVEFNSNPKKESCLSAKDILTNQVSMLSLAMLGMVSVIVGLGSINPILLLGGLLLIVTAVALTLLSKCNTPPTHSDKLLNAYFVKA